MEEKAARAYDLAALKYWGPSTHINFPVIFNPLWDCRCDCFMFTKSRGFLFQLENYQEELEEMKNMSRQEHVAHLRR